MNPQGIPVPFAEAMCLTAQQEIDRFNLPVHVHLVPDDHNHDLAYVQLHRVDSPLILCAVSPGQVIDAIEFLLSPTEVKKHYGVDLIGH